MTSKRVILTVLLCCPLAALIAQSRDIRGVKLPGRKQGMTDEEYKKEIERSIEERRLQKQQWNYEYSERMALQAWLRLLRIDNQEWTLIKRKYEKVRDLGAEAKVGAAGYGGKESFRWRRHSKGTLGGSPAAGKTRDQMPEGYKIVEELIDLLEDEESTDEQIRKKIDALQQARDKAWTEYSRARRELAEVLTTARQEAVFLLLGSID